MATARTSVLLPFFLGLALALPLWSVQSRGGKEDDDPRARQEYLERVRQGVTGDVPPGARLHAILEQQQMQEQEGTQNGQSREGVAAGTPPASQWLFIGPQPTTADTFAVSGRVNAIVVDPHDATGNTVYIGGAQGGVWKSTDGGQVWTPLTDFQPSLAVGALAIDGSTSPATVYVGTGDQSFSGYSYYGAGLLKSSDGGTTWTQLGAATFGGPIPGCSDSGTFCGGAFIGGLSIRPGAPSTLLAAVMMGASSGIYRSTDSGVTWQRVSGELNVIATAVEYATNTIAYAGTSGLGVWKSVDGGASWFPANGSGGVIIPTSGAGRTELAVARSDATGNTVYAAVEASGGSLAGLFKTVNGGMTWTRIASYHPSTNPSGLPDYCAPQCWYNNVVAVYPANPNVVFVGGIDAYKSRDGGTTWTRAADDIHVDQHAMAFTADGAMLYLGNDGGAWKTRDTSTTQTVTAWTNLNATLGLTQFYHSFAVHPIHGHWSLGGTQDNGTQRYDGTRELANGWQQVECGDGAAAVVDAFRPERVYTSCQLMTGIFRSDSAGERATWLDMMDGLNFGDRVDFIAPMAGDEYSHARNHLYFGTHRVYQNKDGLGLWSAVSGDLTGGLYTISRFAVAPSDRGVVYAGTSDGRIARGTNLATADCRIANCFTDVTGSGLPGRRISGIAIARNNPNRVYVSVSGFGAGDSPGNTTHVYRSTAGGNIWTNISGNLPNISVNDVVLDPDLPNTLYVATDIGVFRSTDDGGSWSTLANGLPHVAVFGLKLHRPTRTLRAVTYGRGAWDLYVPVSSGPMLTLTLEEVRFGDQELGKTSTPRRITVRALNGTVTGINVGTPSGAFARTSDCGATLARDATCAIDFTFTPTVAGNNGGGLFVQSSGVGSPQFVSLHGTGLDPSTLSPSNLTFSAVVGRTSAAKAAVFTNLSGDSMTISSVTVHGDYTRTHDCSVLAHGASCTIHIAFAPTGMGARNGTLIVQPLGGSGQSVALSGTGVDFALSLTRPKRSSRSATGANMSPGGSAQLEIQLVPSSGLEAVAQLRCLSPSQELTCSVTPTRVTLMQANTATVTIRAMSRAARLTRGRSPTSTGIHRLQIEAAAGDLRKRLSVDVQVLSRPPADR